MKKPSFESLLFYGLMAIHIAYVWILPVFLTQDGPSHLFNSKVFIELLSNTESGFYQQTLELNWQLFPNWFSSLVLSAFLKFFSAIIAEKLFLSTLFIAFPLSFRFALKSIQPQAVFLSSFSFLFVNSYFLIYGFYNFQWSLVVFCLFLGNYFQFKSTSTPQRAIGLSFLCLFTFLIHPVALILMLFVLGTDGLQSLVHLVREEGADKAKWGRRLMMLASIALPSLLLMLIYFFNQHDSTGSLIETKFTVGFAKKLFFLKHLALFSPVEKLVMIVFAFFSLGSAAYSGFLYYRNQDSRVYLNLFFLLVFNVLIFFFISDELAGGAYLTVRTTIFIYLTLLLLFGTQAVHIRPKRIVNALGAILCLTVLVVRFPYQYQIGKLVKNYISVADHIDKEASVLLPLGFSNHGEIGDEVLAPSLHLFKHINGYIAAEKKMVSLDNYEANTRYFPVIWKEESNPYDYFGSDLAGIELNPPQIDLAKLSNHPSLKVDYVLLWGDDTRFKESEVQKQLFHQLNEEYRLIYHSEYQLSRLYLRK